MLLPDLELHQARCGARAFPSRPAHVPSSLRDEQHRLAGEHRCHLAHYSGRSDDQPGLWRTIDSAVMSVRSEAITGASWPITEGVLAQSDASAMVTDRSSPRNDAPGCGTTFPRRLPSFLAAERRLHEDYRALLTAHRRVLAAHRAVRSEEFALREEHRPCTSAHPPSALRSEPSARNTIEVRQRMVRPAPAT